MYKERQNKNLNKCIERETERAGEIPLGRLKKPLRHHDL